MNYSFDEIPDDLLKDILSRLVCNIELVFQCKCVSKRWLRLISSPDFIHRCIRLQRDDFQQMPATLATIVIFNIYENEVILSSQNPFFTSRKTNFLLDFLPCYKDQNLATNSGRLVPPTVVATYKDLLLCCSTRYHQRDYFICNPITKHWVALPPTPRVYKGHTMVTFVCDPYYYDGSEQDTERISTATMTMPQGVVNADYTRGVVNAEYTWKVVRLVPKSKSNDKFNVEIFSSVTREWRELVVLRSRPLHDMFSGRSSIAVAHKGMLYWCGGRFIFELDLDDHSYNQKNKNIAKCRFIKLPKGANVISGIPYLVVTRGRLRLYWYVRRDSSSRKPSLRAWELKEVVKDYKGGKFEFKWLVEKVPLTMDDKNISFTRPVENFFKFEVVDFHKDNEDIMYFQWRPYLGTCIICVSSRLEIVTKIKYNDSCHKRYLFLFPWWPTPVHI